jgi:hypothetical protein
MANLNDTIEAAIKNLCDAVDASVDKEFLNKDLEPLMERLKRKQAEGQLDLKDLRDFLRIYKNILIPAAKKHNIAKLRAISDMVSAAK